MSDDEEQGKGKWEGKNFMLTLNQVELFDELKEYLTHFELFNYGIATLEKAPSTGHEHIHVYCQYKDKVKLNKTKTCNARIDKCKGSAQQNINYIKKVKEPEKRGTIIWEQGTPKFKGGLSIKEVKEMSAKDRESLPFVYYKGVERLNMQESIHIRMDDIFKQVEVRFIWGPSGMGKTYLAQEWFKELGAKEFDVVRFTNGFWNGASDDCDFAFYDDFRDNDLPAVEFLMFIDYAVKNLNIKGGCIKNRYKYIAITSIQNPRNLFGKEFEEAKQWLRRIRIFRFAGYRDYEEEFIDLE